MAEVETTTLILTSDAREALAMADHLAVMDLGRIVQSGTPAQVYNRPVDAFVARFLGPINLIQGQVESTDPRGDLVVRTPLGRLIGRADGGPLADGLAGDDRSPARGAGDRPERPVRRQPLRRDVERLVFLGEVRQVHLRGRTTGR